MRLCFDARVAGAVLALAAAREASAGAQGAGIAGVSAFDSVSASPAPVAAESLLSRAGWVRVPDGALTNRFRGDAVLMNGRLAVVLRANAAGAEVYSAAAGGMKLRAVVTPLVAEGGGRFASVKLDQNGPDSVRALAKFVTATNRALTLTCEVGVGQPFARTDIDDGAARLRVEAPCRFLVIPEFAKGRDDALVDAAKTQGDAAPVPDANFLLHLLDGGDAVVAVARDLRQGGARLQAVGQGGARVIAATEVPYGKGGQVWVGVIEGPGAWQEAGPAGAARQPYPAGWRTVPGDPGVTYPRDRDQKTPIEVFTVVDLIRAALGPGPCRYILDLDEVLVNIGLQSARSGPKGRALTQEQISAWLAGENARQKQLRSELADLAKAGQRIYYNSNFEGEQKIYAVAPDGSGFARITPASWTNDQQYPHVSPDGSKLVFTGGRLSKQECMDLPSDPDYLIAKGARRGLQPIVWLANVDGSDPKPVVIGSCPHWSWDGRYLAYGVQPKPNVRCLGLLDVEKGREWIFRVAGGNTPTFSRDMKYYIGGAHYIQSVRMEDIMTGTNHTPAAVFNSYGCNQEISPDGKALVHVIDEKDGSWICWYPYNPARSVGARGQAVDLGVTRNSMNYFPEFSPDQKYMAWGHWDEWENRGAKNVNPYNTTAADLYVCRWPPDGVSARITWHGGTTQNPSWAGGGRK